jgi:hypothetical protein
MISQASRVGVKLSLFVLDFLLMQLAGSHIIKKSNSPVVKLAVSRVQRVWVRNPYIFASCLLPACFAFCTARALMSGLSCEAPFRKAKGYQRGRKAAGHISCCALC